MNYRFHFLDGDFLYIENATDFEPEALEDPDVSKVRLTDPNGNNVVVNLDNVSHWYCGENITEFPFEDED